MLKLWRGRGWEVLCFLVFFVLIAYQIFIPPVTGLANNSDFVYVLGKFSVCPADREKQNNIYLVTDYFVDRAQCTWDIGLVSTELPLTWLALNLSKPITGKNRFDLRVLAAVHLVFLLVAFAVLLSVTSRGSPAIRYGIPVLAILIFTDVAYTCYLNSVYLDAPAMVLFLATTAFAAAASVNPASRWLAAGFLFCGVALTFVKSQHAILALIFAALAITLALRSAKRMRLIWNGVAGVLVIAMLTMFAVTPRQYRLFPLYSVIFARLAPHSDAPWDVLRQVGLPDDDMKYFNTHAYTPGAGVYDESWSNQFLRQTGYGKLALYYLRHLDVTATELDTDLTRSADVIRPRDMANYREKDGYPPKSMAARFSLWSTLRSDAMEAFPYQLILIYLAPWIYAVAAWRRPRLSNPLVPLALLLSTAGVLEFGLSTLTDALDTPRHLFIFQVITEVMILLIAACVLQLASNWREARLHKREAMIKSVA